MQLRHYTREDLLAAWEKWGTGKPLPEQTVEFIVQAMNEPPLPVPVPRTFGMPLDPLAEWFLPRPMI